MTGPASGAVEKARELENPVLSGGRIVESFGWSRPFSLPVPAAMPVTLLAARQPPLGESVALAGRHRLVE